MVIVWYITYRPFSQLEWPIIMTKHSDDFSWWQKYLKQAGGRGGRLKAPS